MEQSERIAQLIIKSFGTELTEEEEKELNNWQKASPENLNLIEEFRNDNSFFKRLHEYDQVQEDIRLYVDSNPEQELESEDIEEQEEAETAAGKVIQSNRFFRKYWWAAAALIGVIIVTVYFFRNKPEILKLVTSKGQIDTIVLSDKSRVILNGATCLSYPAMFTGSERHVSLSGEALFEVLGNDARPFTVEVDAQSPVLVKANNSIFNLMGYKDSSQVITSVYRGQAELHMSNEIIPVKAGEKMVLDSVGNHSTNDFDTSKTVNWLCETMEFERAPKVAAVISRLAQWYGKKIVYPDPTGVASKLDLTVISTFKKCEGLKENLLQLKEIGLQFDTDEQKIVVTKRK